MRIRDFVGRLFQNRLTQQTQSPSDIKGPLPFVKLFGYEKAYGAQHPQDFALQVQAYKSWCYACAQKNAFSVAKCNLQMFKETVEKDKIKLTPITQHIFLDTIKSVNPFSNKFELFTITQINLELTGNAYWWMPRNSLRVPGMIWNIPSHWMKIVPSVERFIEGYVMQVPGKGKPIPFDEDEIVHFKFPSPFNLYYGSGPTWAAQYGIDLNAQIKTYGINYFTNNAQPAGVLYTDSGLNAEQYKRLRDAWNKKYKGAENAGKIAILESGLKYQQTGSTLRDARFEDVAREIRDEILAMFGVPASKLGLVEDVNRANADANDYTYQKETIVPRLTLIEEKLNEKVIPIYDLGLICKFESPVPKDNEFRLRERQINIQSGYSSIDDERVQDGLDPYNLPETKVPLIPFGLNPAGSPKPEVDSFGKPLAESNDDKDKDKKGLTPVQKRIRQKQADAKWEKFVQVVVPQERLFAVVMERFFESQHSEVMRNLNKYKEATQALTKDAIGYVLFHMQEANNKLAAVSKDNVRNAYISGLSLGMADTNSIIDFNLFEPNIARAVKARVEFFAVTINRNTAKLIENELIAGMQNGESVIDISRRIDSIYEYSRNHRSRTTAQTEVIGSVNEGQLRAYTEAGIEAKEWISARDEKVRDSHRIDGQVQKLTESFVLGSGDKVLYPGDRTQGAPPGETINCRCNLLPVRKMEE